ncbi:MAG TPA: SDR family oxidoreductase [Polyangiaceae bacterium]|nr:SDR family oxidoreductase [Polyangiaceae bacterium]
MTTFAVVTGASSGIGKELAKLFAADGHGVVLVARRKDELDALARELSAVRGVPAIVIARDLGQRESPSAIFEAVRAQSLDVEFLVNDAGFGSNGAFVEQDVERELQMVDVNVKALVELTYLFLPSMFSRGGGRILNIGSTSGFQPGPFMATYYATKAFVNSFSEALAFELKGTGVTVTLSCPGATATQFSSSAGTDNTPPFRAAVAEPIDVAREAYRAMLAGKTSIIHGFKNQAGVQALRVSPHSLAIAIAAKLNRPLRS